MATPQAVMKRCILKVPRIIWILYLSRYRNKALQIYTLFFQIPSICRRDAQPRATLRLRSFGKDTLLYLFLLQKRAKQKQN